MDDFQIILNRIHSNGGAYWSRDDENIYSPIGSSTLDTLFVIGEAQLATVEHPIIAKAVEFIFTYQTNNGTFRYNETGSRHPCITARILNGLCRIGVPQDERIKKSYNYFLQSQCEDGGWRCNTVRKGKSPLSDASNPGTTLFVLDAFRFRENSPTEIEQLEKGVDFVLQHWDIKIPVGPCQFGIGSRFMQIEYPFMRYNLFYYVYVLSFYKNALSDRRFREAYACLAEKVNNEGVIVEAPHKAWQSFSFATKGTISREATFRWKEIEQNLQSI
jgi:hypothetical protein